MSVGKAARALVRPVRVLLRTAAPVPRRTYAAASGARALLEAELDAIRAAGTWKAERVITSRQGARINVDGSRGSEWSRSLNAPRVPF